MLPFFLAAQSGKLSHVIYVLSMWFCGFVNKINFWVVISSNMREPCTSVSAVQAWLFSFTYCTAYLTESIFCLVDAVSECSHMLLLFTHRKNKMKNKRFWLMLRNLKIDFFFYKIFNAISNEFDSMVHCKLRLLNSQCATFYFGRF